MAAERVLAQGGFHQHGQSVEVLAHVGVTNHNPYPRVCRQAHHVRSTASTQNSVRGRCALGSLWETRLDENQHPLNQWVATVFR